MSEWISVDQMMPPFETDVLAYVDNGGFKRATITAGLFSGYGNMSVNGYTDVGWASWETEDSVKGAVTHWKHQMEPPK